MLIAYHKMIMFKLCGLSVKPSWSLQVGMHSESSTGKVHAKLQCHPSTVGE